MRRLIAALTLAVLPAGLAFANHSQPPTYVDTGPVTVTVTAESSNGEVYHDRNTAGRSGTKCTGSANDDGTSDHAGECTNSRDQLKSKDVTAEEGGPAACQRIAGQSAPGVATWDGVWFNRTPLGTIPDACGDPTTGGAKGRVYTGGSAANVGSWSAAGGGDLASGGCVQAFVEDDTPGNVIAGAHNAATGHGGSDDDTDFGVCFDY